MIGFFNVCQANHQYSSCEQANHDIVQTGWVIVALTLIRCKELKERSLEEFVAHDKDHNLHTYKMYS